MPTTIEVNKQSVEALLGSGKSKPFVIPEYQRPYAWTDEQVETLFEDLWEFTATSGGTEREGSYFLGSIVSYVNEDGEQEIIDGQQRLTTLFLIIEAIKNTNNSEQEKIVIDENKKELCIGNCTIRYKNNIKSDKFQENYKYICILLKK